MLLLYVKPTIYDEHFYGSTYTQNKQFYILQNSVNISKRAQIRSFIWKPLNLIKEIKALGAGTIQRLRVRQLTNFINVAALALTHLSLGRLGRWHHDNQCLSYRWFEGKLGYDGFWSDVFSC